MNISNISFFSKKEITCPGCSLVFKKEELQTGRGRINAGELTEELRRLYIPTQKYGIVNPLLYPIVVCPKCLFAGMPSDFQHTSPEIKADINRDQSNRRQIITKLFGQDLDFNEYRNLVTGSASYILGFISTIHLNKKTSSPTARRGLYALRAAWLIGDLYEKTNLQNFQELQKELYHQAFLNYDTAIDKQIRLIEPFDGFVWMGPDVDTNFGYDGMLYITAMLTLREIDRFSNQEQIVKLGQAKRVLSQIFGVGKSTREKPEVLVSLAKDLYVKANEMLSSLQSQGLDISIAEEIENEVSNENL